ncbi:hypothetical protein JCM18382A_43010 [Bradyrhizobium sp. 17-4]
MAAVSAAISANVEYSLAASENRDAIGGRDMEMEDVMGAGTEGTPGAGAYLRPIKAYAKSSWTIS